MGEKMIALRWVMRRRKGVPIFILQVGERIHAIEVGTGKTKIVERDWQNVPVVDDGKSHEEIPEADWIAAAVKQAWKDRKIAGKEKAAKEARHKMGLEGT